MALEYLTQFPPWIQQIAFSLVAFLMVYLVGQLASRILCRRLSMLAEKTSWQWDDLLIRALRKGIPLWSVLLAAYVSVGFWSLPAHLMDALVRAIYVLACISVTFIAAGLASDLIVLYSSQFQHAMPVTSLTRHIAKITIVVLGLLMILHGMGISITPLLTALGVGGLAVALALQDTLSNVFSGFYLTMARSVRVGDYIKLESGEEGYVEDIGWRATKIRMLPNNMVVVPNNKLGSALITNYYLPDKELAVLVNIGVDYGSNLEQVERVTCEVGKEVMRSVTGGIPEFDPFIRYHTFGEYSIDFTVILRGKEFVDQYLIKHEFVKRLHLRYQQEGITIPFPVRTIRQAAE
ncbi:MAG: mechanosensitive ion channel protein MscS [Candidatus Omnitrophica bacterium CG11_big_fil_rev_8_21_14_0_20_63_9]|nr:MAG: mechanosensitive ion channel protein MscS [Candidatus Omnitrophica bacterium CG11_big_fil_rev_8_21_14_0_20_63_9]